MMMQLDIEHGTAKEIERRRVELLRAIQPLVSRTQKELLWLFSGYTKKSNVVKGDYAWIGRQIGASRSTAYRAICAMVDAELITAWNTRDGLLQSGNEYVLNWEAICEAVENGKLREPVPQELEFATADHDNGTDLAPSVKMTLSRVSKRHSAECQNETQPSVKMTLSTISNTLKTYSPSPTEPPPEKTQPTITDADWEVVVVALQVFGILSSEKIREAISAAKAKGITPQTVMGLIRFAAAKVITLDTAGRPVEQWRMPGDDRLDEYTSPASRLYFWSPGVLLWRIREQGSYGKQGIADGWFCPSADAAKYNSASVAMADAERRSKPPVPAAAMVDPELDDERKRHGQRLEELEARWGAEMDALDYGELCVIVRATATAFVAQVLLGKDGKDGKSDPRMSRVNRFGVLKIFEEWKHDGGNSDREGGADSDCGIGGEVSVQ